VTVGSASSKPKAIWAPGSASSVFLIGKMSSVVKVGGIGIGSAVDRQVGWLGTRGVGAGVFRIRDGVG
jgi:hypothetical protein